LRRRISDRQMHAGVRLAFGVFRNAALLAAEQGYRPVK